MYHVLIYDTECSGLDTKKDHIMEVAWAIFSVTHDFLENKWNWRCIKAKSALVSWHGLSLYEVNPEAQAVTGLAREMCDEHGIPAIEILPEIFMDMAWCDFVGGHNIKGYDNEMMLFNQYRIFTEHDSMKLEIDEIYRKFKFVDSFADIEYPEHCKSLTLKYLALEHGYVLSGAHEALMDVFASAHLFKSYDFEKIKDNAAQPIEERFLSLKFGDPKVDVLKANRFKWNPEKKNLDEKCTS